MLIHLSPNAAGRCGSHVKSTMPATDECKTDHSDCLKINRYFDDSSQHKIRPNTNDLGHVTAEVRAVACNN